MKNAFRKLQTYYNEVFSSNEVYKVAVFIVSLFVFILSVDAINIPTKLIEKYNIAFLSIILIGLFIISLIWLIHNHMIDLVFKVKSVNIVDRILAISLTSTVVSLDVLFVFNQEKFYKIVLLLIFIVFTFALTVVRWIRFQGYNDNFGETQNIYDLKDVFENKIQKEDNQPILINEKAVDYDLFNRGHIIDHLCTSIEVCSKSNTSFVIGLEGSWGSGKTTILNNVKKRFEDKSNIVIIDDFDMWACGTQESLLALILEAILRNTDIKYSNWSSREIIKNISTTIVDNSTLGGVAKGILFQSKPESNISDLKNRISKYLKSHNKKIVFFIDNIDRADAKNVIFLFKLIGTVFDLDDIVYVLSYDRERINNILQDTLDIDPHYIEKIVQQEIKVPKFNNYYISSVLTTCLHNLLKAHGVNQNELSQFDFVINFIISNTTDIRIFKRLINSVFSTTFYDNYLYKPDLLALEVIKFFDIEMYEEIYKNRSYFINYDYQYDFDVYKESFNTDAFNKKAKAFFDKLFDGKDESYKELLLNLFDYVYNYQHGYDIKTDYGYGETKYKDTSINSRVNSAKYFDLYFSYSTNDFLKTSKVFNNMIEEFEKLPTHEIASHFINIFSKLEADIHKEWFEKLYLCRETLPEKAIYPLVVGICEVISNVDDQADFFSLNAKQRAYALLSSLYIKVSENQAIEFLDKKKNQYSSLCIIDSMIYWTKDHQDLKNVILLKETRNAMCDNIEKLEINMYEDAYYSPRNIWAYYRYLQDKNDVDEKDVIKKYILKIISSKYIYRILRDTVSFSSGTDGYKYSLISEDIKTLFDESIDIQSLFNSNPPKNNTEELIKNLYTEFSLGTPDHFGRTSIAVSGPHKFVV